MNDRLFLALPDAVRARHDRDAYPVFPAWRVDFSPASLTLDPGEDAVVQATIAPPAGFTGTRHFNIRAVEGTYIAGGVTVEIEAV